MLKEDIVLTVLTSLEQVVSTECQIENFRAESVSYCNGQKA